MFIAELFTIAKIWKQLKCPSIDEWIKKLWYIYTMKCCAAVQMKKTFYDSMDEPGYIMLSEIS